MKSIESPLQRNIEYMLEIFFGRDPTTVISTVTIVTSGGGSTEILRGGGRAESLGM